MGNKTIILDKVSKRYEERTLFRDFSYTFNKLDRIGIIGPNGCGKSTFLKVIIGAIQPDSGTVEIGQTIQIGYFSQENDALDESARVIDYIKDTAEYIRTTEGLVSASAMCERFLFTPDMQYAPIGKLSGGEKRRLYLLRVLMTAPNVIILDEPTNDLDIQTLRILEDYLDSFAGIIITVSHDRYFLDRVVTRIFAFEKDGTLFQSEGGYSDYLVHKEALGLSDSSKSESGGTKKSGSSNSDSEGDEKQKKGKYRAPREKTKLSYNEQKEYDTIEDDIEKLEERSAELESLMVGAATDFPRLMELTKEKEEVDDEIERKMDRYIELQEMVDSFANK